MCLVVGEVPHVNNKVSFLLVIFSNKMIRTTSQMNEIIDGEQIHTLAGPFEGIDAVNVFSPAFLRTNSGYKI